MRKDPTEPDPTEPDPARKPDVGSGTFDALDLRVGRVLDVELFPEACRPSWKLTVDFGPAVGVLRTSARVTNYHEEELRGRLVVGAVNLGPRRIAGFRSEFLLLGGFRPDGPSRRGRRRTGHGRRLSTVDG